MNDLTVLRRKSVLTRERAWELLYAMGIEIGKASFMKTCQAGQGPQPCGMLGRRYLYEVEAVEMWGRAQIMPLNRYPSVTQ